MECLVCWMLHIYINLIGVKKLVWEVVLQIVFVLHDVSLTWGCGRALCFRGSNRALPAGTWTWACGPRRCRRWCGAASPRRCGARCGSCWQGVTTTTTWWRSTGSSSLRYRGFFQFFSPISERAGIQRLQACSCLRVPWCTWIYQRDCDSILQQKPYRAAGGITLLSFYSPVSPSWVLSLWKINILLIAFIMDRLIFFACLTFLNGSRILLCCLSVYAKNPTLVEIAAFFGRKKTEQCGCFCIGQQFCDFSSWMLTPVR